MTNDGGVLVVGGGVGGLSTGLALHRAGVPVTVLERGADFHSIGGALQVWSNGTAALARLGVVDALKEHGNAVEAWSFRSWRRGELFRLKVGDFARQYGVEQPQMVRRADLVRTIGEALGREHVQFGADCTSIAQDDEGVTATLADGREVRGSVLIGADGIDSKVRSAITPAVTPRHVGYRYVRALVDGAGADPDERDPGVFAFTLGHGDRFGVYPRGQDWLYWFGVVVTPPGQGGTVDAKADLLARFRSFPSPIAQLIEDTQPELIVGQDIRDLPTLERWCDGRVLLVGDAAHAMTPNLGRGASEAIEDAEIIAELLAAIDLSDSAAVRGALEAFEQRRRPANGPVQERSHRIGKITSWQFPLSSPMRDLVMRLIISRKMPRDMNDEFAAMGAR